MSRDGSSGPRALILVEDLPVPFDRRVWSEATTLRDAGWQVSVVCPKGEDARRWHETVEGIEIFRYPLPTTAAGLLHHALEYTVAIPATVVLSLLAHLRRPIDVLHACNPPDFFFPIGRLFKLIGSAFIYDQHDLAPEVYVAQGGTSGGPIHRFLLWCERQTFAAADVVIATNETYARFARERGGVPADRAFVVRSAPDPLRIHPVEPDPELRAGRRQLVVYLGTMGPQDGVDLFIRAARHIADAQPGETRFVVIGDGNQADELKRLAERVGLSDDMDFTGRISDEMVRRYLSTAEVGISPDPANGFNEFCTMNKTLEYMAAGLPVVAFDLEETRVSAGKAAVYAERNDPADLARLVLELLEAPQRRQTMARTGRRRINGPLSWAASAEQLKAAYGSAMVWRRSRGGSRRWLSSSRGSS